MDQLAFWPEEMCEQVTTPFTVVHANHLDCSSQFEGCDYTSQLKWWLMKLHHGISGRLA